MFFPGALLTLARIFSSPSFVGPIYVLSGAYGLWSGTTGVFRVIFPGGLSRTSKVSQSQTPVSSPHTMLSAENLFKEEEREA